jgi:hypothetical protein
MSESEDSAKGLGHWIAYSVIAFAFLSLVLWLWPWAVPFGFYQFWIWDWAKIREAILISWPVYLWGGGITFIFTFGRRIPKKSVADAESEILAKGWLISLIAGLTEEPIFRWLVFYSGMLGARISAFCFFGFISSYFELSRLTYWYIVGPCINFCSAFHLDWLLYEMGWIVGAGAVSANAKFRNEHAYLGWLGYINSWAGGFFLFWIMFNYGLPAAIAVHFIYDAIIFTTLFLHAIARREGLYKGDDRDDPPEHMWVPKTNPPRNRLYARRRR